LVYDLFRINFNVAQSQSFGFGFKSSVNAVRFVSVLGPMAEVKHVFVIYGRFALPRVFSPVSCGAT
jgi:hypothetical protein